MISSRFSVVESDAYRILLSMPVRLLLIAFSVGLGIHPSISENSIYLIGIITFAALIVRFFSGVKMERSFFLGGDLFLLIFLGVTFSNAFADGLTMEEIRHLKVFLFAYILCCTFEIFPTINERIYSFVMGSIVTVILAFLTLHTKIPLFSYFQNELVTSPVPSVLPFSLQGLFAHPEDFGFLLAMMASAPLGIAIVNKRLSTRARSVYISIILLLFICSLLTFQATAWIVFTVPFISVLFLIKRYFWMGLIVVIAAAAFNLTDSYLEKPWAQKVKSIQKLSKDDRRIKLRSSVESFKASPWIGNKKPSENETETPNTYFQILASSGLVGFLSYMGFSIYFLLATLRLWQDIPRTHQWHRSFTLGSLGIQLTFHAIGIFAWTLGSSTLFLPFSLALATISFLSSRYARGIVPDDCSI